MEFNLGHKYIGNTDGLMVWLYPTYVDKPSRSGPIRYAHWYMEHCHDGQHVREQHRYSVLGISRVISGLGFSVDSILWQSSESEFFFKSPWVDRSVTDCIYFIHAIGTDRIKIGWAATLGIRFEVLSCSSPYPLEVLATIPGSREDEVELHRKFANLRVHNEWFLFSDDIKEFIESLKIRP